MWGDPYKGQLGNYDPKSEGWTHKETNLYSTPMCVWDNPDVKVSKLECGGIHTSFLTTEGELYTMGCGSDGRLGHPELKGKVYLYKES